jgi:hypothetical protein
MQRAGREACSAFRSVVSVLLRELGDFSLHPQGRPCGRPPAALRPGSDTTVTGEPASPSRQGKPEQPGACRLVRAGSAQHWKPLALGGHERSQRRTRIAGQTANGAPTSNGTIACRVRAPHPTANREPAGAGRSATPDYQRTTSASRHPAQRACPPIAQVQRAVFRLSQDNGQSMSPRDVDPHRGGVAGYHSPWRRRWP